MKFLVTNMTGFRNKGCEASTKAIIEGIIKHDNKASFKIFTRDSEYDSLWLNEKRNVSFLSEPFRRWYFFSRWWQYLLASKLALSLAIRNGINAFKWADAIISTGGDVFSSTYGGTYKHLASLQVAGYFNRKICLIGHSIGPFESKSEYKAFMKAMKYVELITVRESLSVEYLIEMNLKDTRMELAADPAFCLEPDREQLPKILDAYHISNEKPIIGITPSQSISYWTNFSYVAHLKVLQRLIEFLMKELGYHVVLIPHVRRASIRNDDRIICEKLYANLDFPKDVTVMSLDHSAEEIRALMSKMDLLVAERMHAAIASLAQQVPTFVIGYSVKAQGILGDVFGFENLENYMIPIKKLNEKTLKKRIKNLLDKRDDVTELLSKVIPHVKKSAKRNFTVVTDVLRRARAEK